ncbi:hypothetical protein CRUP_022179 [Coryphaenoides rupestris]|nr:hypothetical protein CRUP_022179 [Coryphaenoides rupestris]
MEDERASFRHASILSPYSKTIPAVIAKASTIYNPFIYAIIHQKYRKTLAEKVPCLRFLSPKKPKDCAASSFSESSFRESVVSRASSAVRKQSTAVSRQPSASKAASSSSDRVFGDVEMAPVDRKSGDPGRRRSSSRGGGGARRDRLLKTQQQNSTVHTRNVVSGSLNMAAVPLLVLSRKSRSQSLTGGVPAEAERTPTATRRFLGNRKSESADLRLGNAPSPDAGLMNVPRIIVISPTSENSLVRQESNVAEDDSVGTEDNDVGGEI